MTYRKEKSTINGHETVVQQTRGPDSDWGATKPVTWIDRKSGYTGRAIRVWFPSVDEGDFSANKTLLRVMAENDLLYCKKCDTFYNSDESVGTGYAGHKCRDCHEADESCQDGNEHNYKCLNPSQKRNARMPTKFKCKNCGHTKQSVPTG